jgi:hypothetical protein
MEPEVSLSSQSPPLVNVRYVLNITDEHWKATPKVTKMAIVTTFEE